MYIMHNTVVGNKLPLSTVYVYTCSYMKKCTQHNDLVLGVRMRSGPCAKYYAHVHNIACSADVLIIAST